MIFQQKIKTLLRFFDNKVEVVRYTPDGDTYVIESKKTIVTTDEIKVQEFIGENPGKVDILIPDEQNYLKLLNFQIKQKLTSFEIVKEIENFIPENAETDKIYWEKIGENEGEVVVSARVIKGEYLKQILDFLKKTNTKQNKVYFESEVIAKSRLNKETPEIILINRDPNLLILVAFKGKVWQSIVTEKNNKEEIIDQIKIDFEKRWKIKLEQTIEENSDILKIIQPQLKEKDNYSKTVNFLLIAVMIISIVVLVIFIPMIMKNAKQTQNNLIQIQTKK